MTQAGSRLGRSMANGRKKRKAEGGGNSAERAAKRAAQRGKFTGVENVAPYKSHKYDPKFCRVVLMMGGEGASETEMAVLGCGVVRATMRNWAKQFPEFKIALDMAHEAALVWWETQGRRNLRRGGFNTGLYNKIISCRFRGEYGEHLKLLGDANEPVAITAVRRVIVDPKAGAE